MPPIMEDFGFFLSRTFASTHAKMPTWPYVPGTYFVTDPEAPVAVRTLGSVDLAPAIAADPPPGLCITGKVETENIGIEKIIKNIISIPAVRFLLCVGNEPPKHPTGATMVALFENGIDVNQRIPGSPGMRPVLPNTKAEAVDHVIATGEDPLRIKLDHAAYIGKELTKAELSIKHGLPYVQDGG